MKTIILTSGVEGDKSQRLLCSKKWAFPGSHLEAATELWASGSTQTLTGVFVTVISGAEPQWATPALGQDSILLCMKPGLSLDVASPLSLSSQSSLMMAGKSF